MKVLLTVLASMMIAGNAMAACDVKSPQDCASAAECSALSKDGGAKYTFEDKRAVKCQLVDTTVATDCAMGVDGKREAKAPVTGGSAPADAKAATGTVK